MKSSSLQFQIEKCTRSVFQLDEVYNSCCFKPDLRKNPVAKTSKELVCFFCRSARFAVLQLLFSGSAEVAAGLSNPPFLKKGCGNLNSGGFRTFFRGPDGFPAGLRGAPGAVF